MFPKIDSAAESISMKATTKPTKKQAALNKALTAKVAAMTAEQQDARLGELYEAKTPATDLEWIKLIWGADATVAEVAPPTAETYLRGTTPRGPMLVPAKKTKTQKT
jgi:hypothetical protein